MIRKMLNKGVNYELLMVDSSMFSLVGVFNN